MLHASIFFTEVGYHTFNYNLLPLRKLFQTLPTGFKWHSATRGEEHGEGAVVKGL